MNESNKELGFNEYQERASGTAIYPGKGNNIVYPTLGLVGEAGEVAEKVKKIIRDNNGVVTEDVRQLLKKEMGDVLWYIAALAEELGFKLSEVGEGNLDKLESRKSRGVLGGSGDLR